MMHVLRDEIWSWVVAGDALELHGNSRCKQWFVSADHLWFDHLGCMLIPSANKVIVFFQQPPCVNLITCYRSCELLWRNLLLMVWIGAKLLGYEQNYLSLEMDDARQKYEPLWAWYNNVSTSEGQEWHVQGWVWTLKIDGLREAKCENAANGWLKGEVLLIRHLQPCPSGLNPI